MEALAILFSECHSNSLMRAIDLTGQIFGRLTVLYRAGTKNTFATWQVRCSCGIEKTVCGHELRTGRTVSCGCYLREIKRADWLTHGMSHTPTWRSWDAMVQRCTRPADPSWARYGGAGIQVCKRWLGEQGFANFLADMGERPDGSTLDRFPNRAGNYRPGNCRWATAVEQNNNKRSNRQITFRGRTQTLAQWARELGARPGTLARRLDNYGWPVEEALGRPVERREYRQR